VPPDQVKLYTKAFSLMDVDGSKSISVHELHLGLKRAQIEMTDEEVEDVVKIMVSGNNVGGEVSFCPCML
jgi:Ca2+-binding EF-hand superfamily protein